MFVDKHWFDWDPSAPVDEQIPDTIFGCPFLGGALRFNCRGGTGEEHHPQVHISLPFPLPDTGCLVREVKFSVAMVA